MSELVPTGPGTLARWTAVLVPASQLAERIAGTEFVPTAMRGKPDVVTAAIMYGDEIGVGPMQALAGIHVVEGRPQPSAELMRALIMRAGHALTVHTLSGEVCRLSGLRAGAPESDRVVVEWNLSMARAAGLVNKKNWREYPRAMLLARATGDLARLLFPDIVKGLGHFGDDQETVESMDSWARQVPDDTPPAAPATTRIERRPRRPRIPEPGHVPVATPDAPAPDGSVDVPLPLPESIPDATPEVVDPTPWTPPPEPPPVAPDPEPLPDSPSPKIGPGLHRGLMAAFSAVAPDHDHDLRVDLASAILARPVSSTKEVTAREGLTLTRILNDIQTGAVAWSRDDAGVVALERVRET
jgi:hypothetical protein